MARRNKRHGQRAHEMRVGIRRLEKDVSETNNQECLIPIDMNLTICKKETIGSHSIQRSILRDNLSRLNQTQILNFVPRASAVIELLYEQFKESNPSQPIENVAISNETNYWDPKEISVSDASVNPFACETHDRDIFKPIEGLRVDFCSSEHLYLLAYRCLLYALTEMYNIRNFYGSKIFMQNAPRTHPLNPEYRPSSKRERIWWIKNKKWMLEFRKGNNGYHDLIPILEKFNRQMSVMLINKDYSGLDHRVLDFSSPISIASSSFVDKDSAMLTVYPVNDTGDHKIILSWFKGLENTVLTDLITEIIRSVSLSSNDESSFLEQILNGSYNVYTSPDYSQKVPANIQSHIRKIRRCNYGNTRLYVKIMGELIKIRVSENERDSFINKKKRRS